MEKITEHWPCIQKVPIDVYQKDLAGDKMTPQEYTQCSQFIAYKESVMATNSGKRLTTRITDHTHEKLQMAADLVGSTLNQFVVQAALDKAESVIESETRITLTRRETLWMLNLLENPPKRNEKFLQAQAEYERLKQNAISTS